MPQPASILSLTLFLSWFPSYKFICILMYLLPFILNILTLSCVLVTFGNEYTQFPQLIIDFTSLEQEMLV